LDTNVSVYKYYRMVEASTEEDPLYSQEIGDELI